MRGFGRIGIALLGLVLIAAAGEDILEVGKFSAETPGDSLPAGVWRS
jgi:hypothetical protein